MKTSKVVNIFKRVTALSVALVFVLGVGADLTLLSSGAKASAAQIQSRSLTVSSSAPGNVTTDVNGNTVAAGAGGNGQKTAETIQFNLATTGTVDSVLLEYCTTAIAATSCTSPTGFTAANVTSLVSQTGFSGSGNFGVDTSTVLTGAPWNCSGGSPGRTNCIALTRSTGTSNSASTTVSLTLGGTSGSYITNPTTANSTFYVRVVTYSDQAYATPVDYGSAASSTTQEINITSYVQESLTFSVGTTVTSPSTTCNPFNDSGSMYIGDANHNLSTATTYYNHSYFRISTNAAHGAAVLYSGNTLTSGGNSITALPTTATASSIGTAQFGIGLDSSDTEAGSGYSFTGLTATSPYNAGNGGGGGQAGNSSSLGGTYAYNTGSQTSPVQIASSTGPITCDTGSLLNLANIATSTPSGIYGTTIDYIAVPTY